MNLAQATERQTAFVDNLDQPFDLNPYLQYLIDTERHYTVDELQSDKFQSLWQSNTANYFKGADDDVRYWFRIKISNKTDLEKFGSILLFPALPVLLSELNFSVISENGTIKKISFGHFNKLSRRELPGRQYAFLLPSEKSTYEIIGWVDQRYTALPTLMPMYIVNQEQFRAEVSKYHGIMIAFYSVMTAMLLYNGCLFLALRSALYGYYLLFLITATISCAYMDGLFFWVLPWTTEIHMKLSTCNGILVALFYLLFVWKALSKIYFSPRVQKYFIIMFWMAAACLVLNLAIPIRPASNVTQFYSTVTLPLSLTAIFIALRKKIPTAIYLLAAEVGTVAGGTSFMSMIRGVMPINDLTTWSLHMGFLCEAMLLSLALAARTRQAQQEAITYLHDYRTIYEESLDGLFEYDLKSLSVHSNQAFAQLLGYHSFDEMPKQLNAVEYLFEHQTETVTRELFKDGKIVGHETKIRRPQIGDEIWVTTSMRLALDAKGQPMRIEGVIRNISEQKLKEKAEQERQVVELASKAKNQFFASMSHEFRTPLTAILGYAERSIKNSLSLEQLKANMQTIHRSGEHLLNLINDILDISKIEAQKLEVESINMSLLDLLRDLSDYFSVLSIEKQISFSIVLDGAIPTEINNDPTRLKQALINLCGNAIKFTERGGVTVTVSCDIKQEIITFAVKDTGIGLHAEQIEHLFAAFTQADVSTSRNFGGTGLGLYLSKKIAEKLGGNIEVQSVYGQGCTFILTTKTGSLSSVKLIHELPQEPTQELTQELPQELQQELPQALRTTNDVITIDKSTEKNSANQNQLTKVLLADDNPVNQQLIGFHVKQTGAECVIANDGGEVISHLLHEKFDLLLIDMQMPKMDGMTAVRYLREKGFDLPIYAITADNSDEALQLCKVAGCNGCLSKPLNTEKLISVIHSAQHLQKNCA